MTTEKKESIIVWGECHHCWSIFIASRKSKKYCSNACKQKAYLARKIGEEITIHVFHVKPKPSFRDKLIKLLHKVANIPF